MCLQAHTHSIAHLRFVALMLQAGRFVGPPDSKAPQEGKAVGETVLTACQKYGMRKIAPGLPIYLSARLFVFPCVFLRLCHRVQID